VRRRVVTDLADDPAARPRTTDRLQPACGLDRQLDLDRHRQRGIGKQLEIRPAQQRPAVRQPATLGAGDRLAGLPFRGA
jgi:hypothetical protein